MKGENMKYVLLFILLVAVIIAAGCVGGNKETVSTPAQTPTPTVIPQITTIQQMTVASKPTQNYKTADLVISLNTNPTYGFKMDYPTEWTFERKHTSNWKAGYNFSSPDGKSYAFVYVDDTSGSAFYWYSINKWANNSIKSYTQSYCLDGVGNPMVWDYCQQPQTTLYHPVLMSNDPVIIPGSFEAHKLVFTSYDDRYYGQRTVYIMHSGRMQGYNFTIPDHTEVAVKVDGPVWDYGIGGQGYSIEFYSPADQMKNISDIFNHMINSFEATTKL